MGILEINGLEKHDEHNIVFPSFSLEVSESEVIAIHTSTNVRTSLLKQFMGEIPISNGEILVNKKNVKLSKRDFFSEVGFFCLDDELYERLSVKENFSFFQKLYESDFSIDEGLHIVQLETKRNVRLDKLSKSEKRRAIFGRLLIQNPTLFVFEEPDQNIDLETKRVFLKMVRELKQKGKAVLMLTSNMESALSITDQVYRLDDTGLHALDVRSEDETANEEMTGLQEEVLTQENEEEIIIQPVRFEKIPTKVNDKIVLFDPPEIDYIESRDGQSNIYIKGEMYPSVFTMTELENRLHPYGFFRCHRSYIVNLQKVREVVTWTRNSFTLVLGDAKKSSIPLSKTKMAELKTMLGLK
ncbi:LytTR family transcriptional regulator DNA-binding domain-containing protein [Cytobacillus dafuensis]|uniref:LytR family transcriptional regulator n=1 Tax=Cytobacillus dafuensis TaxID=1742359 RepID=A0A5B8Z4C8_CYTDA|nr:LytTR family transcriptional regulator DNA-binding domain-containing protein [Cytobacillus dafuensis]QED46479.1 LytR family transcriptional regulator [Cytobacillus dafuensis]